MSMKDFYTIYCVSSTKTKQLAFGPPNPIDM